MHKQLRECGTVADNVEVNLRTLREATAAQHEAVEAMLPLTAPDLTLERYGELLQCFAGVVQAWEAWAVKHAPARLARFVRDRQRTPLLLRDLSFFGLKPLAAPSRDALDEVDALLTGHGETSPQYEAVFLGAMYVMEGSTLGGQYIARHVEDLLGLAPGQGDAYFRGYGEETGQKWNEFRELLGAVDEEHSSAVIASAQATFGYVQDTMRGCRVIPQHSSVAPVTAQGTA